MESASVSIKMMGCDTKVVVVIERCGWLHAFKLSVEKPLPEEYQGDPLIVDAYTRGRALTLERNRRFGGHNAGGKAACLAEPE